MTRAAARPFNRGLADDWIVFKVLKWVCITAGIIHFSLAAVAGYRALTQIYSVSLDVAPGILTAGAPVSGRVSSAGRTFVPARIELIQGSRKEVLAQTVIDTNRPAFYDFRPKRATLTARIPDDIMQRFAPGPAALRLTADTHMQLMYVPPSKSQTVAVELR